MEKGIENSYIYCTSQYQIFRLAGVQPWCLIDIIHRTLPSTEGCRTLSHSPKDTRRQIIARAAPRVVIITHQNMQLFPKQLTRLLPRN